ncbi:transcriptional regulator, partial [Vibrio sp. 10N.261.45.F1]
TVVTPREQIGKVAAQQVVARLQGNKEWVAKLDLGYEIEVGESI